MKKLFILVLLFISFNINAMNKELSSKELNCLTQNAFFEANGEGDIGMLLVTNVVFNRSLGGDVCKTIHEPYQFSWTLGVKNKKIPINIYNQIQSRLNEFSKNRYMIPRRFINATFYHARGEHPKWVSKMKFLGAYKNHLFYRRV